MKTVALALLFATEAIGRTGFWAPVAPPRAHYAIDAKFVPDASRLEGVKVRIAFFPMAKARNGSLSNVPGIRRR